jgi:Fic family protein
MFLIDPTQIKINQKHIDELYEMMKAIHRFIIFSVTYSDDDLLAHYSSSMYDLKSLLSLKNAQMEAQTEGDIETYLKNLKAGMCFIESEITQQRNFSSVHDLIALLRIISPEAHERHPSGFRATEVQVGAHICPAPAALVNLVEGLFTEMEKIKDPITRAIYLHHELVRIHPFCDGNGRISRMAKNWMLMFELLPPIFINDLVERRTYITTLASSFQELMINPHNFCPATQSFFEQEIQRIERNIHIVHKAVFETASRQVNL